MKNNPLPQGGVYFFAPTLLILARKYPLELKILEEKREEGIITMTKGSFQEIGRTPISHLEALLFNARATTCCPNPIRMVFDINRLNAYKYFAIVK